MMNESNMESDCISRQAAIDIVQGYAEQLQGYIGMPNDSEVYAYARGLLLSIDRNIKALQSAQPDVSDTNVGDIISRQAVYNVLDKMPVRGFEKDGETIHGLISLSQVNSAIINLPSAQPEIIRCKECVYADSFYHCDYMTTWNDGECFCCYGKRRTDE